MHKELTVKTAKIKKKQHESIENVHKIRYDKNSIRTDADCNGRKEKNSEENRKKDFDSNGGAGNGIVWSVGT